MKLPVMNLPTLPSMPKRLPTLPSLPGVAERRAVKPATVEEKVVEVRTEFLKRAQADAKRVELVTDTEYWCCLCFETREQKETFLKAAGLWEIGDKYLDGREVARKLGIDPGEKVDWPKTKGLSDRLKKHVE